MIRFVVRQMDLEEMQPLIDGVDETEAPCQGVDGADAAVGQTSAAVGNFIVDFRGGEHRLVHLADLGFVEPANNAALAVYQLLSYLGVHSKSLSVQAG